MMFWLRLFLLCIPFWLANNLAHADSGMPVSMAKGWLSSDHFLQLESDITDPLALLANEHLPWQPLDSFSFRTQQQQWLRLSLEAHAASKAYLVLGSPHLRELQIFALQDAEIKSFQTLGSGLVFGSRQTLHHMPTQVLRLDQATELLILLPKNQQVRLSPKLLSEQDYQHFVRQQDIANSLGYGFMLALIVLALTLVLIKPNPLHISFLGLIVASLLSFFVLDGMAYQFIWPHNRPWPEQLMHQVILVQLLCATLYGFFVLQQKQSGYQQSFYLLGWFAVAVLLSSPYLSMPWLMVISISYAIVLLTWSNVLSLVLFLRARENLLITLGYFAIWPGVLIYSSEVLGWVSLQERGLQYFKWCLISGLSLQAMGMAWRVRNAMLSEQKKGLKNKLRSQFFAQVSHEIRNPIQGIIGLIDILKSQAQPEQQQIILSLNEASQRLNQLVNDVLDQEKLNYGQVELRPKPTDIRALLHRIHSLGDGYRQEGVEALLSIDPRVSDWLAVDSQRLAQVINNLLSNAYKFTTKGKVELSVTLISEQQNIQWLLFSIKDQGPGISPSEQERLFKPFSQTELGKEQRASSGLGLYISQQLVQLMNSKIELWSQEGQGSEFYFKLKLLKCKSCAQVRQQIKPALCWVVEDNVVNQQILNAYLKIDNHSSKTFSLGADCVAELANHQPEVIIMDFNLTDTNGIELCKTIRQVESNEQRKACFIIGLTGETDTSMLSKWQQAGADLILNKPVQLQQLRAGLAERQVG